MVGNRVSKILAGAHEAEAPQCLIHLHRLAWIKVTSQWLGTLIGRNRALTEEPYYFGRPRWNPGHRVAARLE